mgnify:CR=1 FL=1
MIVDTGKLELLDELMSNVTDTIVEIVSATFDDTDPDLAYGDLTIASWSGGVTYYNLTSMGAATMDGTRAKSTRSSAMSFLNEMGSTQTGYGWAWSRSGVLIGAKLFDSPQSVPDLATLELTPSIYLDNLTL